MNIDSTPDVVAKAYDKTRRSLDVVRKRLNRPLTLAEKVLFGHLDDPATQELAAGKAILQLRVDRVAMQDATAQMAILQFSQAQIPQTAVPSTVHCDHLIQAYVGAAKDTDTARSVNKEVYDFLASASNKYGIGFWKPGAGIIHQVVLENYAFPGGLMIGTDSHTPNAGGLGMIAVGVGGADAVDAMAGLPWEVKHPKMIGVKLSGALSGWASPKDVILWVCQQLTVKGGTDHIVEYFGPGCASISATGKGTICNMGAEHGATTSIFPYDERMATYLKATRRSELAALAAKNADLLRADEDAPYDKVLELDLSTLEPYVTGPHTPDRARPISKLKDEVVREGFPDKLSSALIGSCTNSSYEDIARVVDVARQAKSAGVKTAVPFLVSPGSDQIYETIKRDDFVGALEGVGATVLANACGPCIGQWKRDDVKPGEKNSILNSFNRNFPGRNDGNAETLPFIASPEIVMALGLAGRLSFNPLTDALPNGAKLRPPAAADEVPPKGFVVPTEGYDAPAEDGSKVEVIVDPKRRRIQSRACRDVAPLPRRGRDPGSQLRPHPRDEPEEAGRAAADVREPRGLREGPEGRPHQHRGAQGPCARQGSRAGPPPCRREDREDQGEPLDDRGADRVVQGGVGAEPAESHVQGLVRAEFRLQNPERQFELQARVPLHAGLGFQDDQPSDHRRGALPVHELRDELVHLLPILDVVELACV